MVSEFDRLAQALAPGIVLERELASGGMGTVYVGREVTLDRLVAIKILQPRLETATGAADTAAGCALVRRAAELWQDADASLLPARAAARARAEACRS